MICPKCGGSHEPRIDSYEVTLWCANLFKQVHIPLVRIKLGGKDGMGRMGLKNMDDKGYLAMSWLKINVCL